jgi:hypothetical protein
MEMRYPDEASVGSSLFPKLLGSYEQELHAVVRSLPDKGYTDIVDIGCAEGYYAVGLARMLPGTLVHAYDPVSIARELCRRMGESNGVIDRLRLGEFCDAEELMRLDMHRALIWCDCEGYERKLFNRALASRLADHDVLIEVHEFIYPSLPQELRQIFSGTHDIEVIRSVPDFIRPAIFPQPHLKDAPSDVQIAMMAELRPADMKWFWCQSRSTSSAPGPRGETIQ